jgi:hypothetical protein
LPGWNDPTGKPDRLLAAGESAVTRVANVYWLGHRYNTVRSSGLGP